MVTVTVCYVLVNVAYYTMMTAEELLVSHAVAVVSTVASYGQSQEKENNCIRSELHVSLIYAVCLSQTFANRALHGLASVIPVLVAVSCLGALNGGFFGAPR